MTDQVSQVQLSESCSCDVPAQLGKHCPSSSRRAKSCSVATLSWRLPLEPLRIQPHPEPSPKCLAGLQKISAGFIFNTIPTLRNMLQAGLQGHMPFFHPLQLRRKGY